jgi:hypothetical protein
VHVFAQWLEHQHAFEPVGAQRTQAVEAYKQRHGGDDCALWHHRQRTLKRHLQALFFAPLLGIARLSAFDTHAHPLQTRVGQGYQSSTLRQFLGQLERVGADEALMPTLFGAQVGQIIYVDGPMSASWSRQSMHKGQITMLGRIMAGSQAVIAHDANGQALFVAYDPPDLHVSQVIVASCQQVAEATRRPLFVIDRAVNAGALASAFDAQGFGLLCMLDANEPAGLESCAAGLVDTLEDGTTVESGPWQERRADDPRHLVIVVPTAGKTLVSWGTPLVKESVATSQGPRVYRERNAMQELRFKARIDHGALDINDGRKTTIGPDRPHQRKIERLDQGLESADKRAEKQAEAVKVQQDKVAQAEAQGHGKRLAQRKDHLATLERERKDAKATHVKLCDQRAALGPVGQRADRDFRTQTIMTIRTLVLENLLGTFLLRLLARLQSQGSVPQVLSLLFERSGAQIETPSQLVYWVNSAGLSLSNRRLLSQIAPGLGAMGLHDQGKPISVRLKDIPP